jgi:hypothetical protein
MQVARPLLNASRPKIRRYRRVHLRAIQERLEKERLERERRLKFAQKRYDYEWNLAQKKKKEAA